MTVAMPVRLLKGERLSGARCPRCDARLVYVKDSASIVYCGGCGHEPSDGMDPRYRPPVEDDEARLQRMTARADRIRALAEIIALDRARLAGYEAEMEQLLTVAAAVDPSGPESTARYRARVLKAARAAPAPCPECEFFCSTKRGLAIHRALVHGVPGITALRKARKAARKEAAR